MTRLRLIALNLLTGTAVLLAQDPQTGGWRRWDDPLPRAGATGPGSTNPAGQGRDTGPGPKSAGSPKRRSGYPEQAQQSPRGCRARPPAAVPHYGLPNAVAIKPGTFITDSHGAGTVQRP